MYQKNWLKINLNHNSHWTIQSASLKFRCFEKWESIVQGGTNTLLRDQDVTIFVLDMTGWEELRSKQRGMHSGAEKAEDSFTVVSRGSKEGGFEIVLSRRIERMRLVRHPRCHVAFIRFKPGISFIANISCVDSFSSCIDVRIENCIGKVFRCWTWIIVYAPCKRNLQILDHSIGDISTLFWTINGISFCRIYIKNGQDLLACTIARTNLCSPKNNRSLLESPA